jgi:hypothetical protein
MLRKGEKRIGNCARTVIEMLPTKINGESLNLAYYLMLSISGELTVLDDFRTKQVRVKWDGEVI